MKRRIIPVLFSFGLLFSCVSVNQKLADDPTARITTEPLQLRPRAEIYHARADLIRAYHTSFQMVPNGYGGVVSQAIDIPNPYHYIVADLGNSIVLDANGNLSVDLIDYFNLDETTRFTIIEQNFTYIFGNESTLYRKDTDFNRSVVGTKDVVFKAVFSANTITIENGLAKDTMEIVSGADDVSFDPFNCPGWDKFKTETVVSNQLSFPGLWGTDTFKITGQDQIELGSEFSVIRQTDSIIIIYRGFLGKNSEDTFIRLKNGFIFFDKHYIGTEVYKEGNTISVLRAGVKLLTYKIQ